VLNGLSKRLSLVPIAPAVSSRTLDFSIRKLSPRTGSSCPFILLSAVLLPILTGCVAGSGGFIENDTLALDSILNKNEDRNLTQTSGIAWDSSRNTNIMHRGLRRFNHYGLRPLVKHKDCEFKLSPVTSVAVTAYTPDNLTSFAPVIGDRPYATLLTLSGSDFTRCKPKNSRTVNEIWTSSLSLGYLGTTIGEDFQRWVHETAGGSESTPNGWDNQISDGGEPTFLYSLDRSRLFKETKRNQHSYSIGANVGYYTNIHTGYLYRRLLSGRAFSSDFQDVGGTQIVNGTLSSLAHTSGYNNTDGESQSPTLSDTEPKIFPPRRIKETIFFFGLRAYGVIYNATLQGQFRNTGFELDESKLNYVLAQLSLGLSDDLRGWCKILTLNHFGSYSKVKRGCAKITRNTTRMTFALHSRSAEYNSEFERTKPHVWAGLHFTNILNQ